MPLNVKMLFKKNNKFAFAMFINKKKMVNSYIEIRLVNG